MGVSSPSSSTKKAFLSSSERGVPTAAPAGETCLNDAAAGMPVASRSSRTSCHELRASRKLMYPGVPESTVTGRSEPSRMKMRAGFWLGLQPYLSSSEFIRFLSCVVPSSLRLRTQTALRELAAGEETKASGEESPDLTWYGCKTISHDTQTSLVEPKAEQGGGGDEERGSGRHHVRAEFRSHAKRGEDCLRRAHGAVRFHPRP